MDLREKSGLEVGSRASSAEKGYCREMGGGEGAHPETTGAARMAGLTSRCNAWAPVEGKERDKLMASYSQAVRKPGFGS